MSTTNKFILGLIAGLLLTACGPQIPPPDRIIVYKSERELALVRDEKIYKVYNIGLGKEPTGHKEQEGDNRTPEGHYFINGRNPKSHYFLSLRISYPDEADIADAQERGVHPGKDIMIHGMKGRGTKKDFMQQGDWTQGCIALTNHEIQELWHVVEDGTPITILP